MTLVPNGWPLFLILFLRLASLASEPDLGTVREGNRTGNPEGKLTKAENNNGNSAKEAGFIFVLMRLGEILPDQIMVIGTFCVIQRSAVPIGNERQVFGMRLDISRLVRWHVSSLNIGTMALVRIMSHN
jgi:hypothetical protein